MLYFEECERPIAQQIFGSDKDSFVEAAKMVEEIMHPDIIDINMGCPVPKVAVKSQAGAALLKFPDKIRDLLRFASASGPNTSPNTRGAPGYPNFFIPKPIIPNTIAIRTSKRLLELENAPTIHRHAISGRSRV